MHDHLHELLRCWEAVEERFFPGAKCSTNYYVRSLDEAIHTAVNEPPACNECDGMRIDLQQCEEAYGEEIEVLESTIEDLRNELHDARSDANALRDQITELKRELQEARCDS